MPTDELEQKIVSLENQINDLKAFVFKDNFTNTVLTKKDFIMERGVYQSANFVSGSTGWQFDADGNLEANAGTFRGKLKVGGLVIGVSTTESIQDAINEVNTAGGGTVLLKSGTHTPGGNITLYSNVNLEGLNKASTFIDFENAAYGIRAVGSNAYTTGTLAVNKGSTTVTGTGTSWTSAMIGRGIMIKGIVYTISAVASGTSLTISLPFVHSNITGQAYVIADFLSAIQIKELTVKNSTTSAIKFQYAQEWFIYNVPIQTSALGIDVDDCTNGTIDNVDSIYNTNGFDLDNHHGCMIQACGLLNTQGDAIDFNSCSSTEFRANFIFNSTGDGVRLTSCEIMALMNNTIENSGGQGIEFVSGNNNIIVVGINASYNTSDGIKLTATSDKITISNSQVFSNGGYGINIAASTCDDNIISSNNFSNNTSGNVNDSGTGTIILSNLPRTVNQEPLVLFKTADETLTADNAAQDDNHLLFAVEANKDYLIDMVIFWGIITNGGAGGLQDITFSLPSGATLDCQLSRGDTNGATSMDESSNVDINVASGNLVTTIRGVVKIGGTAGTVTFRWGASKNTPSDTVTVTIYKGSWLSYQKLS